MSYCSSCGKEIIDGASFCNNCGASVNLPVINTNEEQEFLDMTHRLLRWEQKAWRICGMVLIIVGAIFAGYFGLFALIGLAVGDEAGVVLSTVGIVYSILFGSIFIGIGIVERSASKKIPQYLDSMYYDFRPTYTRCDSVGMLIFSIFFGEVALVFFLINFIRMKCNKKVIQRIVARQQNRQ